jgi:outer membrane protein assembly factor BamA
MIEHRDIERPGKRAGFCRGFGRSARVRGILPAFRVVFSACILTSVLIGTVLQASEQAPGQQSALYGKTIREIRIVGARHTRHDVIRRELKSKVGEPFLESVVIQDHRSLDRLGIFAEVRIYGEESDGGVVMTVEVKETLRFLPMVSLNISDENGISAGAGLKSVNLAGKAVYFSGVARFGGATTVELILRDPWVWGNHLGYQLDYYHRDRRNELYDFEEVADEGFLTVRSYVGERGRIGFHFSFQSIRSSEDGRTLSKSNTDNVAAARALIAFDSIDLMSNPTSGWWAEIDIERSGLFNTDSDFIRTNLDLRRYFKISDRQSIAASSLTTLTTGKVSEDIAVWQQFGLGGTNSVRGWELGSVIGKNQMINTLEYRYMLMPPRSFTYFGLTASLGLQITAFGDLGWAWEGETSTQFGDSMVDGYGAGLRFLIPYVGVARLDFGVGQPRGGIEVHLGGYEKQARQRERVR